MGSVLIVSDTNLAAEVRPLVRALRWELVRCFGPQPPSYTCVGGLGGRCALASMADVVVLDMELASDDAYHGTTSVELMEYYLWLGKPVVALAGPDLAAPHGDVTVLPRGADAASIATAVVKAGRRISSAREEARSTAVPPGPRARIPAR